VRRRSFLRRKQMSAAILAALITLMLSAAVAGAITLITCTGTNPCEGTNGVDRIEDSDGYDEIYGYGGGDEIYSSNGSDTIYGGGGRDFILANEARWTYGEEGNDSIYSSTIITGGSSDTPKKLLSGGPGDDFIDAENVSSDPGEQTVQGGPGNDTVDAADGYPDVINCGGGKRDSVDYDRGGVDTVSKCEKKRAL
jgi:Ca2+-binding RTX toxin-like protein